MYVKTPINTIFYKGYHELHFFGVGKVNANVGIGGEVRVARTYHRKRFVVGEEKVL